MLRTSERTAFKRCRQAWWWAFVDQLKPIQERPPLRFGSLVHKALEVRYPPGKKRGPHPAIAFEKFYKEDLIKQESFGFKDSDGVWHDALALGIDMLNAFVEEYGEDEEWEVLASELPFQVELHRTKRFVVKYTGIIDGVWRHRKTKHVWINDWKTAKAIQETSLPFNEQATSYWGFAPIYLRDNGIIGPKDDLRGIYFTYLRKAMQDTRPVNADGHRLNQPSTKQVKEIYLAHDLKVPKKGEGSGKDGGVLVADLLDGLPPKLREQALLLGPVSESQPPKFFHREPTRRNEHQSRLVRERALEEAKEMMRVKLGQQAVLKTFDQHCSYCLFKDQCELHESGHDWESFRDATTQKWEPYAEHEIEAAELR